MKSYPRLKIFITFSLCPSLSGVLFAILFFVGAIERQHANMTILKFLLGMIPVFLITGIMAVLLYGIPAMVAAAVYLWLKPYKNWRGFLMVATIGGVSSCLWNLIDPWRSLRIVPMPIFGLGAATSFVMALFVLPRKTNEIDR